MTRPTRFRSALTALAEAKNAAVEAGPVCGWTLACNDPAAGHNRHPALGLVPACTTHLNGTGPDPCGDDLPRDPDPTS